MAKEYFSHDYHARDHLRDIRKDYGMAGVGVYWCFVEILHENEGYIDEADIESIAYDLHADADMVRAILYNYNKFSVKKDKLFSERALSNIKKRNDISEKRRAAAQERWDSDKCSEFCTYEQKDDGTINAEYRRRRKQQLLEEIPARILKVLQNDLHGNELFEKNIYDCAELFNHILEEVKDKDYVIINKKKVHVDDFLMVVASYIQAETELLRKVLRDVHDKYLKGKVKNKTAYLMSALFNAKQTESPFEERQRSDDNEKSKE